MVSKTRQAHRGAVAERSGVQHTSQEPQSRLATRPKQSEHDQHDEETSSSGITDSSSDDLADEPSDSEDDGAEQLISTMLNTHDRTAPNSSNIQNRLTSFFSQLAEQRSQGIDNPAENEILERAIDSDMDSGYEDDEDDGQQYVELNLALGVLSEQGQDNKDGEIALPRDENSDSEEEKIAGEKGLQSLSTLDDSRGDLIQPKRKAKRRKIEELGWIYPQ